MARVRKTREQREQNSTEVKTEEVASELQDLTDPGIELQLLEDVSDQDLTTELLKDVSDTSDEEEQKVAGPDRLPAGEQRVQKATKKIVKADTTTPGNKIRKPNNGVRSTIGMFHR